MEKTLENYLKKYKISYKEHFHNPVFRVAESKSVKSDIQGLHTKCLFLKGKSGNFYLVCMAGEKRLDIKKLTSFFSEKKINFSSEKELFDYLRVKPGSVSLFCSVYPESSEVKIILDKDVWDSEIVNFHPNINNSTLEITHEALEFFFNSLKNKKYILEL